MLNWSQPTYIMPINQVQNLQKQLAQLKEEAKVNRIPVSEAVKDLLSYISQNVHEDSLVNGINQSNNPFIPKSPCSIMWKKTGHHFLPSTKESWRAIIVISVDLHKSLWFMYLFCIDIDTLVLVHFGPRFK